MPFSYPSSSALSHTCPAQISSASIFSPLSFCQYKRKAPPKVWGCSPKQCAGSALGGLGRALVAFVGATEFGLEEHLDAVEIVQHAAEDVHGQLVRDDDPGLVQRRVDEVADGAVAPSTRQVGHHVGGDADRVGGLPQDVVAPRGLPEADAEQGEGLDRDDLALLDLQREAVERHAAIVVHVEFDVDGLGAVVGRVAGRGVFALRGVEVGFLGLPSLGIEVHDVLRIAMDVRHCRDAVSGTCH